MINGLELHTVLTEDSIELNGLLAKSDASSERIIIYIHGMGGTFFRDSMSKHFLQNFPKKGVDCLTTENRGTGGITFFDNERKGVAFEDFEKCIFDISAWIDLAEEKGYKEIWLISHSLGTCKAAYYSYKMKDNRVTGQIWISPSEMYGLVRDDEGKDEKEIMYQEAKKLISENKEDTLLSIQLWKHHYMSAKTYLNLFGEDSRASVFNYFDTSRGWKVVNDITVPVLAITGTNDDGVCTVKNPREAMNLLEKNLSSSNKTRTIIYENANHGFRGFLDRIVEDSITFIDDKFTS